MVTEFNDIDQIVSEISKNINAVRTMDYNPFFGGYLVTTGYSNYINVWSPDSSLSKSYVGRLEGHSAIVINCKIFQKLPNCISIDEKNHIRIWDLRNLMPI